jgi:hypothetical protein
MLHSTVGPADQHKADRAPAFECSDPMRKRRMFAVLRHAVRTLAY